VATCEDPSGLLIQVPYADTADKLVTLIAPQKYTFQTTSAIRTIVHASPQGRQLLGLVPGVIIDAWKLHPNVGGILATLLSASLKDWDPPSSVLLKLEQLCMKTIRSDEWTRVPLVEPVAFAIAAKGRPGAHREVLQRLVMPTKWRDTDITRQREYYGSAGEEIAAVMRHWTHDRYRKGLLRAHDVGRLMVFSDNLLFRAPQARDGLTDLLQKHAQILSDHGEQQLARSVMNFTEAVRTCDPTSSRITR
jgi:hypothetical protein